MCIIGTGDDRARLEHLATAKAPTSIEFTGFLSDEEVQQRLAQASLFALPSRAERFGLVYLEAMTHGVPCIVADAGAAIEVITSEIGLASKFGDVSDLATKVTRALQTSWDHAKIRERARVFDFVFFDP
ncbi:MAG: glycosyltransferase family 4 protein [Candidatus Synoicihabitans palmerolidicus]|nr:glycosyltransferase family 4 protein [Candidatus Synoicihabitans palmerolidicus]